MMTAQIDVDRTLTELKAVATKAMNEEELKINAERILHNEVLSKLGLQPGRYEYTFISGGRSDALYGHVLIEYKAPGKLSKAPDIAKAKEQLIGYIKKEAEVEDRYKLFLGVILCDKIAFIRYDSKNKDWPMRGPYDLNRETVLRLIEALRGLRRKMLAVDKLLNDFGPRSNIATKAVKAFYDRITKSRSSKAKALFNDWKRLFSQVCAYSPVKLKGLEVEYGISGHIDYNALLFSIHTYYALIMKLLGAEVAYLYGAGKWLKSYVAELEDAHMKGLDALKTALEDLESGGVFRKLLNIINFMEGDYFSWYLEELDKVLADILSEIAKGLADYEPATPVLEPEYTRDLLKKLYQNLVPKKIRHDLGEYYTPDWLAELVLDEAGLSVDNFEKISQGKNDVLAPLSLRVLDPACGSGTFLILVMKRSREYAEEHYLKDILANYILKNIVGFDLNPLAVLTARTNYLLAIADLFPYVKGSIEIPIYLSDSLHVEQKPSLLTGKTYMIRTYVDTFQIPQSIVENGLLGRLLEIVDRYVRLRYKSEEFEQVVKNELNLDEGQLRLIVNLYKTFLKLEEEGKNHVWTSIIKNAFAPLIITRSIGGFDFVIGNPPWLNWESLPESYRISTKNLWDYYGLLGKTKGMGLGKVKRDMAMLFLARCLDTYVKNGSKLSFLIPFTAYKTQAGAGFRKFLANGYYKDETSNSPCKTIKVDDLVTLYPFEGATNRTSLIVIEKDGKTQFPIPCKMWDNPRGDRIGQEFELEEVEKITRQSNMILTPVSNGMVETPWMIISKKAYEASKKITGQSPHYEAHMGIKTALNAAYWVSIVSRELGGILIKTALLSGQKKTVGELNKVVEPDLIYPIARGRDLKRWYVKRTPLYMITPHSLVSGQPLLESKLRVDFPKTYSYLSSLKTELQNRSIHKLWGKDNPFYSLYDIGSYSFSPYKVAWKAIAGKITGKAVSFASAVLEPIIDSVLSTESKSVLPDNSLITISTNNRNEAHYICAVLNSKPVLAVIASYAYEIRMETHVVRNINIPKFNPQNIIHTKLSELSIKAHELAEVYFERNDLVSQDELNRVEKEIDNAVAQLYGLTTEELIEIEKCLTILRGGEVEEEEAEEELKEVKVDFLNAVLRPKSIDSFNVIVSNPLNEKITIDIQLPDRLVKIKSDKVEDKIRVKIPPLEVGEYKIPYKIATSKGITEGEFILYIKEETRHKAKEAFTSKLDELMGD